MVLERFLIDMGSYLRQFVFHSMGRWIDISEKECKILVLIVLLGEHAKVGRLGAISSIEGKLNYHESCENSG